MYKLNVKSVNTIGIMITMFLVFTVSLAAPATAYLEPPDVAVNPQVKKMVQLSKKQISKAINKKIGTTQYESALSNGYKSFYYDYAYYETSTTVGRMRAAAQVEVYSPQKGAQKVFDSFMKMEISKDPTTGGLKEKFKNGVVIVNFYAQEQHGDALYATPSMLKAGVLIQGQCQAKEASDLGGKKLKAIILNCAKNMLQIQISKSAGKYKEINALSRKAS